MVNQPHVDSTFDAVLAEVEAAQVKLVNGQPDAFKALWSQSDDVTSSGGLPVRLPRAGHRSASGSIGWRLSTSAARERIKS
jgi:hypothetical protein